MEYNLFHVDNVEDGKKLLDSQTHFDVLFFDHDLGGRVYVDSSDPNTGYQLALHIKEKGYSYEQVIIHSLNQVGAENILSVMKECSEFSDIIPFTRLPEFINFF